MDQSGYPRRNIAHISELSTAQLHLRNPWVAAFWSFAFPGCGNLIQNRNAIGMILIIWELIVNTNAKLNLAILYTLVGEFEMAKNVIDTRWFLLYVALYVYGIWDGYRGTIDLNKQYLLANWEDAPVQPFIIKNWDTHFLDKRNPWLAVAFSFFMPGLGHMYVNKYIIGMFMVLWTIVVVYFSNCLQAIHFTMTGNFLQAKAILDMQWLMYIPSIYGFVSYDSFVSTVEINKLLEKEQSRLWRDSYQSPAFKMSFLKGE